MRSRKQSRLPQRASSNLEGAGGSLSARARELLDTFAGLDLRRVDIALGIEVEIVHPAKLAGVAPARAERLGDLERLAIEQPDDVVRTVRNGEPLLFRVA